MTQGIFDLARNEISHLAAFGLAYPTEDKELAVAELLHPNEVAYSQKAPNAQAYRQGRIAAKRALSCLVPTVAASEMFIDRGVFGFPVVKNPRVANLQVSISHCEATALALAYPEAHPLGVDIERIRPDRVVASESLLTSSEYQLLNSLPVTRIVGLTLLWTIKEALSKVLKCGLTVDWSLLSPQHLEKSDYAWKGSFTSFGQYQSLSWIAEDWVCSVVLPSRTSANLTDLVSAFSYVCQTLKNS